MSRKRVCVCVCAHADLVEAWAAPGDRRPSRVVPNLDRWHRQSTPTGTKAGTPFEDLAAGGGGASGIDAFNFASIRCFKRANGYAAWRHERGEGGEAIGGATRQIGATLGHDETERRKVRSTKRPSKPHPSSTGNFRSICVSGSK